MSRCYCPNKGLAEGREKGSFLSKIACNLLGDRIDFMFYRFPSVATSGEYYIEDAIRGGNGFLGLKIALILFRYIPVCKYPLLGRNIVCRDIINHSQLPNGIIEEEGVWKLVPRLVMTPTKILKNKRYLVAIQDGDYEVYVYLFRKNFE